MGWNLPPGVTGNEYEIAGPDAEWSDTKEVSCSNDECTAFEKEIEVEVDIQSYRGEAWFSWTCTVCSIEHDEEFTIEADDDYDPYDD